MIIIGVVSAERESIAIKIMRQIMNSKQIKVNVIENEDVLDLITYRKGFKAYVNEIEMSGTEFLIIKITSDYIKHRIYDEINFHVLIYESIKLSDYDSLLETSFEEQEDFFQSVSNKCISIINGDDENILKKLKNIKMYFITYGLGTKSTITASSISDESEFTVFIYCIQRTIKSLKNRYIEPQEFPVKVALTQENDIYSVLAAVTGVVVCDIPIIKNSTSKLEIV